VEVLGQKLLPYCRQLGTKVSVRRGEDGSWIPAFSGEDLTAAVHDNLRNLGLDMLDVVNLRSMFSIHVPVEGSIEAPLTFARIFRLRRFGFPLMGLPISTQSAEMPGMGGTPRKGYTPRSRARSAISGNPTQAITLKCD
jgi:hypothetical protein